MNNYYIFEEIMDCFEDKTHEFKAHRNLRQEEIPSFSLTNSQPTRKKISAVLNAFLNTGLGGTVYIGVIDSGIIIGMPFTQYRKDHFKLALQDLMQSYEPPVEEHRYSLKFVPVVPPTDRLNTIENMVNYDSLIGIDEKMREKPHKLRSSLSCWCDYEQIATCNRGDMLINYVAEICIQPWDHLDGRNINGLCPPYNIQPMHADEEGHIYIRGPAGNKRINRGDLPNISRSIATEHMKREIDELKQKLKNAQPK